MSFVAEKFAAEMVTVAVLWLPGPKKIRPAGMEPLLISENPTPSFSAALTCLYTLLTLPQEIEIGFDVP